jgi:acetyltransferase-like isoleucine patch superfamily enzyme
MDPSSHELAVSIERMSVRQKLAIYAATISTHPARLPLEQLVFLLASWVPTPLGVAMRALLYPLIVRAGWPLVVEKNVTLHRPGAIRLGRNVFLGENVYMLAGGRGIRVGDYSEILPGCVLMIRDYRGVPNAGIDIGHHVGINTGAIIFSHGATRIGDDVLIGPGAVISTSGHTFEDGTRPIRMQRIAVGDIEIGTGAWIGARAVVLPGVRIGEGAVVGAGAVAATDVPAHSLAVGVPARVVRSWAKDERDGAALAAVEA